MKYKHNMVRLAVVLTMLIVTMSVMAQPGVAANGIDSATLSIYVQNASGAAVNVHRITVPWTETGVTWNNFGGFDPEIVNSFLTDSVGWHSVDVTALVQAWYSGDNFGLLLKQGPSPPLTDYPSSEYGTVSFRPKLEVCFSETGCVTIQRGTWGTVADAYIWENWPDVNGGTSSWLYTGLVSGYDKQSLLRFELPPPPPPPPPGQGCTPGYWRNLKKHGDEWVSYIPEDDFEDVFGVDASFDPTDLGSVVRMGGGGEKALARHAVAALLNATSPGVGYYYSELGVIEIVRGAYASGDFEAAKDLLESQNGDLTFCPID